jgi:Protein of unknown function (DUF3631)
MNLKQSPILDGILRENWPDTLAEFKKIGRVGHDEILRDQGYASAADDETVYEAAGWLARAAWCLKFAEITPDVKHNLAEALRAAGITPVQADEPAKIPEPEIPELEQEIPVQDALPETVAQEPADPEPCDSRPEPLHFSNVLDLRDHLEKVLDELIADEDVEQTVSDEDVRRFERAFSIRFRTPGEYNLTDFIEEQGFTFTAAKPIVLRVLERLGTRQVPFRDVIPASMADARRWICYRLALVDGKWKKPPHSPEDGSSIGATEEYLKDHFATLDDAIAGVAAHDLDGVGFVFMKGDGLVGLDFDHAIDKDGNVHPEVQNWLRFFSGTYAEVSPSGTGLHVVCRGKLARALVGAKLPGTDSVTVEAYAWGRYLTVTGRQLGDATEVTDCQPSLDKLLDHLGAKKTETPAEKSMTKEHAQKVYNDLLGKLRDAVPGSRNDHLNAVTFFAAKAHLLLDKDEKALKQEIFEAAQRAWGGEVPDGDLNTARSAWEKGVEQPLALLDPDAEVAESKKYVDDALAAEGDVPYPEEFIRRASHLGLVDYESRRKKMYLKLGFRPKILDAAIAEARGGGELSEEELQGEMIKFENLEPWAQPVDGAVWLNEVVMLLNRYVVMPEGGAETLALWALFTYFWERFNFFPYVVASSPTKRCGKTTLRDLLAWLVCRPLPADNATSAFIFRVLSLHKPTLFIDEADNWFKDDERRSILNAGAKRGGGVGRTVGENFDPRLFSALGPKFIGLIGQPPDTILDRSIEIRMSRRRPDQKIADWPESEPPEFLRLRRQGLRWAQDNSQGLSVANITRPEGINDREWNLWAPLLAIASACGGYWPERSIKLCQASVRAHGADLDENELFLGDVRGILGDADAITIEEVAVKLNELTDRPWHDMNNFGGITTYQVTQKLTSFNVKNRQKGKSRSGEKRGRYVTRKDLEPVFEQYPETRKRAEQLRLGLKKEDDDAKT